jgi:hypothetical protein
MGPGARDAGSGVYVESEFSATPIGVLRDRLDGQMTIDWRVVATIAAPIIAFILGRA